MAYANEMANDMRLEVREDYEIEFEDQFEFVFYKMVLDHPGCDPYRRGSKVDYTFCHPKINDNYETEIRFYSGKDTFAQCLFTLRPIIRYWCDVTRATRLVVVVFNKDKSLDKGMSILLENPLNGLIGDGLFNEALHLKTSDLTKKTVCIGFVNDNKPVLDVFTLKSLHLELMRVAWHPNRAVDWCFDEDEKSLLNEFLE